MKQAIIRALFIIAIAFVRLHAQSFDVASIRPHDPSNPAFVVRMPTAGHFEAEGAPLKLLVMLAYRMQESQITGGPAWFATGKWDIEAKCDDERHTSEETRTMLQHLLEERFSLRFHREAQQRPVYLLKIAKGGPKFQSSDKGATNVRSGPHSISMEHGSIAQMTEVLATALGRPVIDRTGLAGLYDLSVVWDDAPVADGGLPGTKDANAAPAPGDDHGSIFTAIETQLGLALKPSRESVDVLVVDRAERATAN